MELMESKSDNDSLSLNNNKAEDFAKDFKMFFNSIKYNKNEKGNNKKKDNNNYKEGSSNSSKKKSKNIISNKKPKDKKINSNSTPVEFFNEFKDYIKGGIKKNTINNKEKEIQNSNQLSISERNGEKKKKLSHKNIKKIQNEKDDIFWQKVKFYIDLKNEHLNELTYRVKMKKSENFEENKSNRKLNRSSFLFYPKKKKPLYAYKNIDEDSLSKNFENFYKLYQKEQNIYNNKLYKKNHFINDTNNDNSFNEDNKYQKFYEKKIEWIRKRDNKINLERNKNELQDEIELNSFSFRPHIDKNSILLINKRNDFMNFMQNKPNTERIYPKIMIDKKEMYQKYLATIRPYMSFYYEKHSPFYKRNNLSFTKRRSSVNIGMIHINKGKNINIIKDKGNDNSTFNISQDKNNKTAINKKNNIFKMFKPEKKEKNRDIKKNRENENKSNNNIINIKQNTIKQKIWRKDINENDINNFKNEEKKYDFKDLYKVNVRDNSSWNKVCINKIVSRPRDKNVIKDFLYI